MTNACLQAEQIREFLLEPVLCLALSITYILGVNINSLSLGMYLTRILLSFQEYKLDGNYTQIAPKYTLYNFIIAYFDLKYNISLLIFIV